MEFRQIKTGLGITLITNETINSIAKVRAFEGENSCYKNSVLFNINTELLKKAKRNNSYEVACLWNLLDNSIYWEKGNIRGVSFKNNIMANNLLNRGASRSLVVVHNHPRNGLFSSIDVTTFIRSESIYIMIAVCNDGTIHMMKKLETFSEYALLYYYSAGDETKLYGKIKNVIKHQKQVGIQYRCSVTNKRRK